MKDAITNISDQLNIWRDILDIQTWRYEILTPRRLFQLSPFLKPVELISQFVCSRNIWNEILDSHFHISVELTVLVGSYGRLVNIQLMVGLFEYYLCSVTRDVSFELVGRSCYNKLGDRFEEEFSGRVEYGHFESEGIGNHFSRQWD